jgi:5-methylcytosine-specific restriction endonuclease McrA
MTCLNCDEPVEGVRLFCGYPCRQTAKTIRYVRAARADGRADRDDVAEAIKIRIASILGGGYPEDERRLTKPERRAVFDRDHGKCCQCGAEATEVDHVDPRAKALNTLDNLQALCSPCHRKKTLAGRRPIETDEERERATALLMRLESPVPVRECDAADWDSAKTWRGLLTERRQLLAQDE